MPTLHTIADGIRTAIEALSPLTDSGRPFRVLPSGHIGEPPQQSREVILWSAGWSSVGSFVGPCWYQTHILEVHVRYALSHLRSNDRLTITEDACLLHDQILRTTQTPTRQHTLATLVRHSITEPSEEAPWSTSVLEYEIMQEVNGDTV